MLRPHRRFMAVSRTDLPVLLILLLVVLYLETVPPRAHPIPLAPSISQPHLSDIVPIYILLPLGLLLPPLIYFLLTLNKSFFPFTLGLFEALIFTVFFTNALKLIIARPRPYYATECKSYVDITNTTCTGDPHRVAEALKSFPSGHSSYAFAAATYLSLYLSDRFRAPSTWRMMLVFTPYVVAALVAASRVVDYHHHYADIVAGSALGIAVSCVVYQGRKKSFLSSQHSLEETLPISVDTV